MSQPLHESFMRRALETARRVLADHPGGRLWEAVLASGALEGEYLFSGAAAAWWRVLIRRATSRC